MPRGDSLARQFKLWQILEDRRQVAAAEVARELGYTARTVYRDFQVLERIGVPIYQDRRGRRSRWRVVEGQRRRLSITLSRFEMAALTAGRDLLSGLAGTVFFEAARSALEKIHRALPAEIAAHAVEAARRVSATGGAAHDYRDQREVVDRILDALERRHTVRIAYRKPGGRAEERVVDPYHLHLQGGALYLFALDHARRKMRTFLVDRIGRVDLTGEPFEPKQAVAPGEVLQGSFGPWSGKPAAIRLRFDRRAAPLVAERRVHLTQTNQWRNDGKLDVELRAPICPPVVAWVLGWGARVKVVGPERLAELVRREHERACRGESDRT